MKLKGIKPEMCVPEFCEETCTEFNPEFVTLYGENTEIMTAIKCYNENICRNIMKLAEQQRKETEKSEKDNQSKF